jgi:hypothetical protein
MKWVDLGFDSINSDFSENDRLRAPPSFGIFPNIISGRSADIGTLRASTTGVLLAVRY